MTHDSPARSASNTPLVREGLAALRRVLLKDNRLPFLGGRVAVENLAEENLMLPLRLLNEVEEVPVVVKEVDYGGEEGRGMVGRKGEGWWGGREKDEETMS